MLPQSLYTKHTTAESLINSPLADWLTLFLLTTFKKLLSLNPNQDASKLGLQLHDPLCIWYAISPSRSGWEFKTEDIRVETAGQWTRGCCIVDRRGRPVTERTTEIDEEVVGDAGWWGDSRRGNKVGWCTKSPGTELFAHELLQRVFGKAE